MIVEIWSDIACPWCYIGRRRFENALASFEHRDQVKVIWRSFELDPNAPRDYAGSVNDLLAERYGMTRERAERVNQQVTELAAVEGLEYHMNRAHPVNSLDAHRLIHLAAQHNLQSEMKERLQKAYFTEGAVVSDVETLVRLAVEVGLNADETHQMLTGDSYHDAVRADQHRAQQIGIHGVPFFLLDGKYAVSGAQPTEIFTTALQRAWADAILENSSEN
ncbi:MAG: disulfide bond formation protein DsbA [Chloroflexi bacterium HGW-Chloroflexi-8]|jgi:predicted DsbA family dithiol-disulfide isomerase|nr:MAG: disulfide bond formation protein DsbA [Chloroflexi bacterium HGW-Chloroflexi-8]